MAAGHYSKTGIIAHSKQEFFRMSELTEYLTLFIDTEDWGFQSAGVVWENEDVGG